MSLNPYESPMESHQRAVGVLSGSREDLRKVATYQRALLWCILINVIMYILFLVTRFQIAGLTPVLFAISSLAGLASLIFVFLLSMKVYGPVLGVILGILTIVPCLGLIVLLYVNNKATNVLKANGIPVGFMGADTSRI